MKLVVYNENYIDKPRYAMLGKGFQDEYIIQNDGELFLNFTIIHINI